MFLSKLRSMSLDQLHDAHCIASRGSREHDQLRAELQRRESEDHRRNQRTEMRFKWGHLSLTFTGLLVASWTYLVIVFEHHVWPHISALLK
jgi:hypothetical protein